MMWIKLIEWVQSQDTLTIIIAIGIFVYLIYKGVINIPSISEKIKHRKGGNPHLHCVNYPDLGNRLSRLMVIKTDIDRTVNIDILKEQMNLVDQVTYDIRKKSEHHFEKLLRIDKPNIENVSASPEHIAFENIARLGEQISKDILRFVMKENHIPEPEAEFILYAKDRTNHIINHVSEEFAMRWHKGLGISKDRHTDACRGKIPGVPNLKDEVEDIIIATLRKCRDVYDKKWKEIVIRDNEAAALFPEIYERVTKKDDE
jgi:hypothetical protein